MDEDRFSPSRSRGLRFGGARPVGSLRNLGPKSAKILAEAGIRTIAELRLLGPAKAYARAKSLEPGAVSRNLLWAMAAGLQDRDWRDLTPQEKSSLLAQISGLR